MRVFFAIPIPLRLVQQIENQIVILRKQLKIPSLNWIPSDKWHITLHFLKNLSAEDEPSLINSVKTLTKSIPAFHVKLGDIVLFPSKQEPIVLAVDVIKNEFLINLQDKIGKALIESGFLIDKRIYRPHLSIARLNHKQCEPPAISSHFSSFVIKKIILYQSHMGSYKIRHSLNLN